MLSPSTKADGLSPTNSLPIIKACAKSDECQLT